MEELEKSLRDTDHATLLACTGQMARCTEVGSHDELLSEGECPPIAHERRMKHQLLNGLPCIRGSYLFWCAVLFAVMLPVYALQLVPYAGHDTEFSNQVVLDAMIEAAHGQPFPSDTDVRQSQDTPSAGADIRRTRPTEPVKYVITIYPLVMGTEIEKYNPSQGFYTSSHGYLVGFLSYYIAHELCHRKDNEAGNPGNPHTGEPKNEYLSCEHIAIAYQLALEMCDRVAQINNKLNDPNVPESEKAELRERKRGICDAMRYANGYNTPDGAKAAKNCQCPMIPVPPAYDPPPGAGTNPPMQPADCLGDYPTVGGRPIVIPTCTSCN